MSPVRKSVRPTEKKNISRLNHVDPLDDTALVRRARRGDPFAENAIYREHAPFLLNMAARLLGRLSDADDVVQETFIVAFKKLDKLSDPKALKSWLIRILISQVHRAFRVRRLKAFFGMDRAADDASLLMLAVHDTRPDLRAELHELDGILQKTPVDCRTAWILHRIEGMSISETSQAMRRSVASVKRYLKAADDAVQSRGGRG